MVTLFEVAPLVVTPVGALGGKERVVIELYED